MPVHQQGYAPAAPQQGYAPAPQGGYAQPMAAHGQAPMVGVVFVRPQQAVSLPPHVDSEVPPRNKLSHRCRLGEHDGRGKPSARRGCWCWYEVECGEGRLTLRRAYLLQNFILLLASYVINY